MRKLIILVAILTPLSTIFAQSYAVDPGHTSVTTKVMRFGVVPVVGRFTEVSGEIEFNKDNLASTKASITIQVSSYSANNIEGESAIKSKAFLDVANYPEIKFTLNGLTKRGSQTIAKGTLELHGTLKNIECPVVINGPLIDLPTRKQSIGIVGSISIDRTEYGAGQEMKLPTGLVIIGNDVQIDFVILALAN